MSLTKTVVNRPTTLIIIFGLLVLFGLYTAFNLAIDLFPEISFPGLALITSYSGAGPEEIEKTITRPLESTLSNVSNIKQITSTSSEGTSLIFLEFTYGTNMAEAANDVRDRLEFIKDSLPEEATTPQILKFDMSMIPILRLKVSGNRSPEDLREIAENYIQPRLEQIDGVALASVRGGKEKIIRVEIPQNRLEAYDLNFTQIKNMLMGNNLQISAGTISEGTTNFLVRSAGEFVNVEEIKNTVVAYKTSAASAGFSAQNPTGGMIGIRLRDIADVFEGFKEQDSLVFINGEPGVFINVQKQSGTNSVQVADRVFKNLPAINRSLPLGINVGVVRDTTQIIRDSLQQVSSSALLGVLFAIAILFIFLRSLKSTIVISTAIPISLIITLMLMYFFNLTLNLMTLTGLALGLGMLVDNSIVILENIYRYREKGAKLHASAILGAQEMITAITASTLTTICVFLPLALFRNQLEVYGEMFSGLAFTVVISLSTSLIVAILLVPVLTSKYVQLNTRREIVLPPALEKIDNIMGRFYTRLENLYKRILKWVLSHKKITIISIVGVFIASFFLIPLVGLQLIPVQEQDSVELSVELPTGTSLEITHSVILQFEEVVKQEVSSYQDIVSEVGEPSVFGFLGQSQTNKGSITITLPPYAERKEGSELVKQKLRGHFGDFPGAEITFSQRRGGGFTSSPFIITFKSDDRELSKNTAQKVLAILKEKVPEITEPILNLEEGLPEIEVKIDRDKAYSLGLSMAAIGQELRANIDGITAGKYRTGGSEYDILLILDEQSRNQLPDLEKIFIMSNFGQKIALASFAEFGRSTGPININRENQTRYLRITGGIAPGASINTVIPRIQQLITEEIPPNENLLIEYGGDFEDMQQYFPALMLVFLIAVLLVFGIMAAQFESFLDPFIIVFTIPLTLIGVIAVHFFTGEAFSLFTIVGLIMLGGIVVNNGIVLVDYTNLLRKRGRPLIEACIEAGGNRLRPVLMTTLTTVLGLAPIAFLKGEGASLVQPIAKTVVGGLTMSTFLTLFLIPVLYAIFNKFSDKLKQKKRLKQEKRRQIRLQRMREERSL
ncbi:MAG: efflux RND transporter permease subunit [Spirochaetales bacterium]|nr:efflux RND transporter permease subunit [Spirochaetales bacterium]